MDISGDKKRDWPDRMAPAELRHGKFVEDEKLLMHSLNAPDKMLRGSFFDDLSGLYNKIVSSYLKRLNKPRT